MFSLKSRLAAVCQFVLVRCRSLAIIPEPELIDFPFLESDIGQLHRLRTDRGAASLDEATWKDLMLDKYHVLLSKEVSIFGQQALYRRLRAGRGDADPATVEQLMRDPAHLEQLHARCTSLRHATREIATLVYEDELQPPPWWAGKPWLPMLLLAVSIAGAAWSPLSWIVTGLVLYQLIAIQIRHGERMESWQRSLASLQMLLRVATLLGGVDAEQASKFNRQVAPPLLGLMPLLREYMNWFMLANVNHYYKSMALVAGKLTFVRGCFERVSNLEADVALARHFLQAPSVCRAVNGGGDIDLREAYHPLLEKAQPLSLALAGKGAFISGQNGIGKSTLLRTVGLNLAAARAFGFCHAAYASVPDVPVYASMQSEDSLMGGESLYMAELRRAKELLASVDGPHPGVCIIDEIFRGTNHMESISAAASLLDVLAAKGWVIVSSHNLVLAPLLAHRLEPRCVTIGQHGALTLVPGVLAHTNGIALLAQRGFGGEIEAKAARVFDWLSAYLADPVDCSGVLA